MSSGFSGLTYSSFTTTPFVVKIFRYCNYVVRRIAMLSFTQELYKNFETIAVHVGSEPNPVTGAVVPPISLATTYAQQEVGVHAGIGDQNSFGRGYEYQRSGNPTRGAFERQISACEGGKHGLAFSSGTAATSCIANTLANGDHVICIDDVYGGTQKLFRNVIRPKMDIEFTFMDLTDVSAVVAAILPNTKIVWMETITNPSLKITDIKALCTAVHEANPNVNVVVDNTFASPYLCNPLGLGADIVMQSCTKYIGGHSDVLMGAIVCNKDELYEELRYLQNACGAVPSPFDCYMTIRGMKTLAVRMEAAMKNAMTIATFLENTPSYVTKVSYPGLKSHPGHMVSRNQMRGFGAMVTFYLNGGLEESSKFLKALKILTLCVSLGAVESLAECPALMTHANVPAETRAELGLTDNLIRVSVGVEHIDDLLSDISQALAATFRKTLK